MFVSGTTAGRCQLEFTEVSAKSLGEKLDAMELTEEELALLNAILYAAATGADNEVSGFGSGERAAPSFALASTTGILEAFTIQLGTSDLQNAENVRSQAEKRLETSARTSPATGGLIHRVG